ncbi:MAG: metalloregulator ArsR/SmtB family transcription factor [Patescibacteria group bacterium]|jgi:ArsR family transcriptional regulator
MIQNHCRNNKSSTPLLAEFLKIISEDNRLAIICFLQKYDEQCVCKIWEFLELPQNLTSHHLKVLKDFDLLNSRKEGLNVYYSINEKELNKYRELLNKILSKGEFHGKG